MSARAGEMMNNGLVWRQVPLPQSLELRLCEVAHRINIPTDALIELLLARGVASMEASKVVCEGGVCQKVQVR